MRRGARLRRASRPRERGGIDPDVRASRGRSDCGLPNRTGQCGAVLRRPSEVPGVDEDAPRPPAPRSAPSFPASKAVGGPSPPTPGTLPARDRPCRGSRSAPRAPPPAPGPRPGDGQPRRRRAPGGPRHRPGIRHGGRAHVVRGLGRMAVDLSRTSWRTCGGNASPGPRRPGSACPCAAPRPVGLEAIAVGIPPRPFGGYERRRAARRRADPRKSRQNLSSVIRPPPARAVARTGVASRPDPAAMEGGTAMRRTAGRNDARSGRGTDGPIRPLRWLTGWRGWGCGLVPRRQPSRRLGRRGVRRRRPGSAGDAARVAGTPSGRGVRPARGFRA